MNRVAKTLLCGLTLAASIVIAAGAVHAQGGVDPPNVNPTHYWTYHAFSPPTPPQTITVTDQFFLNPVPLQVDHLERLLNWVHKNNSPVPDTFVHYTWWDVQPKLPMQVPVILTNQFGQFPAQVENVEFLLTPAWKNQPQPTFPLANHYLCYRAHSSVPPQPQPYQLIDEWRQDYQYPYPLEYLCTPCSKNHQGIYYPAPDTITHLAVYPITPSSEVFFPFIQDQFAQGFRDVQQFPLEYLFVPTDKRLIITDTKKGSWGKVKQLYR